MDRAEDLGKVSKSLAGALIKEYGQRFIKVFDTDKFDEKVVNCEEIILSDAQGFIAGWNAAIKSVED